MCIYAVFWCGGPLLRGCASEFSLCAFPLPIEHTFQEQDERAFVSFLGRLNCQTTALHITCVYTGIVPVLLQREKKMTQNSTTCRSLEENTKMSRVLSLILPPKDSCPFYLDWMCINFLGKCRNIFLSNLTKINDNQ